MFAMTVDDVTDILQTLKHNFQSKEKQENMLNLVQRGKISSNEDKHVSVLFANLILMSALFLLRYYGSCYRLQHVENHTKHRRGQDMWKRANMWKKKETCRKKQKNGERRQKSKKRKGAKIARCLMVKYQGWDQFYTFHRKTLGGIFCFSSISVHSLGGPIVQIPFIFSMKYIYHRLCFYNLMALIDRKIDQSHRLPFIFM